MDHAIGGSQRGALRHFDPHHELRQVGGREQAAADRAGQWHRQQRDQPDQAQRTPRVIKRAVQQRAVNPLDPAVQRAQQAVAFRIGIARQQAAGDKRDQRHRHDQRSTDRAQHRHRHRADEFARSFGQRDQRQKGKHQAGGAAEYGQRDLPGSGNRGLRAAGPVAQPARHVFDHHDGIVDQQPQRQDKARHR